MPTPFYLKKNTMANQKKEIKKTITVRALMELPRVGLAYSKSDVFELDAELAKVLINDGLVEKCGK
jgi:hypothetical protein|tara:strand:+ start:1372 stop:1569 length:198 start_codon:yes stop_codon:yes gene_type:complete